MHMHTPGGTAMAAAGWAVLRCGRWRKAIKRFCCGPRFFPSSALSSRLSTSPAHACRLSPLPRRLRLRHERTLERKPGFLLPLRVARSPPPANTVTTCCRDRQGRVIGFVHGYSKRALHAMFKMNIKFRNSNYNTYLQVCLKIVMPREKYFANLLHKIYSENCNVL